MGASAAGALVFTALETFTDTAQGTSASLQVNPIGAVSVVNALVATGQGTSVLGTNTNDNAAANYYGEYTSSIVLVSSAISLTSGTVGQITSLTLGAGDWEVWGEVWLQCDTTTTVTIIRASIHTVSAAHPSVSADNTSKQVFATGATAEVNDTFMTGLVRVLLSGSATYYMNCSAAFAVSFVNAYGVLRAWRRQ
jgi:hypothetical protein